MVDKHGNSSAAAWSLITEGVTAARVDSHRLRKLISAAHKLVESNPHREHFYQAAGDLIMSIPQALDRLERSLDRTSYALAKIGEDHLKDRLPLSDRAMVEDGIQNSKPFPGGLMSRISVKRVARAWQARHGDDR